MSCEPLNDNDNWSIPCFDNDWEPNPDELDKMYLLLDKGTQFQLEWKCVERRRRRSATTEKKENKTAETKKEPEVKNKDYDFMDEMSSPLIPVRRSTNSTPKGSAKKKTTNFAGVLDSMKKHGRLSNNEKMSTS